MPSQGTAGGLYYEIGGNEAPDAETLILSAGLGGSAAYWKPNLAALGERFRILAYDQRGTGRSDRDLPEPVSIDGMADDVLTLMDALAIEDAHLMGHALGGLIGLALALKAPQRLKTLVVINGWATPDPHLLRCFEVRLALLASAGPRAYLRAQPLFLYPASWISQNAAEIDAEEPAHLAAMPTPAVIARRIQALLSFDASARLGEIQLPVLALAAQDDMLVPSGASSRLVDLLPQGTLKTLPWGGHACNVTYPARFERIVIEFLRRRTRKRLF